MSQRAESDPTPTEPSTVGRASSSQEGSAILLVLCVVALAVVLMSAGARLGDAVLRQQRAQSAADVAALAGANSGEGAAGRVSRLNGAAVLRARSAPDGAFGVTVRVDGVSASAAAARS